MVPSADLLARGPSALLQHVTDATYRPPGWQLPGGMGSCNLAGADACRRFLAPSVADFLASLFVCIQQHTASHADLPPVRLSGHDLFHAHLFIVPSDHQLAAACRLHQARRHDGQRDQAQVHSNAWDAQQGAAAHNQARDAVAPRLAAADERQRQAVASAPATGGVGLLFHAKEYPQYCATSFPFQLGYCQADSTVEYDQRAMDTRNIVYFKGQLLVLDVGAGQALHAALLREETLELRTVDEGDLGTPVADVCYFSHRVYGTSTPPTHSTPPSSISVSGLRGA